MSWTIFLEHISSSILLARPQAQQKKKRKGSLGESFQNIYLPSCCWSFLRMDRGRKKTGSLGESFHNIGLPPLARSQGQQR